MLREAVRSLILTKSDVKFINRGSRNNLNIMKGDMVKERKWRVWEPSHMGLREKMLSFCPENLCKFASL